jgi:alkanesulfonate monooxygenase SsuD/methylene tetrahydromethanopterin reductase-like flavin-dependent oxidoreductase (luciferase family)
MLEAKVKYNIKDHWELTYEELLADHYVIVGSPQTVAEKLARFTDELGAGVHVGASMHVGDMPHWKVVKNMTLFAEEVMPLFREKGAGPIWSRGEPPPGAAAAVRATPEAVAAV